MNARYPGTCNACRRSFPAGTSITYTKGEGSRHVTCPEAPATAPTPAAGASSAPYVAWGREEPCRRAALDARLAATLGQTKRYTAPRSLPKVRQGVDAPAAEPGVYTVAGHGEWRYQNAEDNQDMGDCCGANWSGAIYLRRATAEEIATHEAEERREADAKAARDAKIAADKAAKEAAEGAYVALLTERTAGLLCAGESFDRGSVASRREIAGIRGGIWDRTLYEIALPSGAAGVLEVSSSSDDDRARLWAPEADVHASWAALAARTPRLTRETAAEWLRKYGQCSGSEFYRWVAAQAPAVDDAAA